MCDGTVHCSACWYVATFPHPFCFICTEESCVVSLLHHDVGYSWPVVFLQANTCLPDGYELWPGYLLHLSLRYPSSVVDDPSGFEACGFVELDQQLSNHVSKVLNYLLAIEELLGDLLAGGLHPDGGTVPAGVAIHTANDSSNGRLLSVPGWGVCDIRSQEDDRLL